MLFFCFSKSLKTMESEASRAAEQKGTGWLFRAAFMAHAWERGDWESLEGMCQRTTEHSDYEKVRHKLKPANYRVHFH